jgi:hypothetical protein
MRLHGRLPALAVAVLLVSCETLAGSGGSAADFTKLREGLASARGQLDRAVSDGETDQIAERLKAVGTELDDIQAKSSPMNLMDRESLSIQIASARQLITTTQQWVVNSDADGIRDSVQKLDGVLDQIDALLERAVRSAATPSSSPQ